MHGNQHGEFIYNYNKINHSIDVFNLTTSSFIKNIQLFKDGPEAMGELDGIYVHNQDSIFMYSRGVLGLKNGDGIFIDKLNLFELVPYEKFGEIAFNAHFRMEYNSSNSSFLFYSFYPEELRKHNPIITSLNLKTKQLDQVPIFYSAYHNDIDGNVGYLSYLNKSYQRGNFLVYNFEYESNIYTFDLNTQQKKVYGAKSKYSSGLIEPISQKNSDGFERHAIENPHYFHVMYDPFKKLYYRLHWGGIPYVSSNNQFNSFIDKPLYLMVLNDEFEILREIELPKNRYGIHNWSVTRMGILLSNSHPLNEDMDENYLSYDLIKITLDVDQKL